MSVIVIGDRSVGKTSMIQALKDSTNRERVDIEEDLDFPNFKSNPTPTDDAEIRKLTIKVDLPISKRISVDWTDTPGEAFTNRQWRKDSPDAWNDLCKRMAKSKYLILLLPPHKTLVQADRLDHNSSLDDFQETEIWFRRFGEWLDFLSRESGSVKHIMICLNKSDYICDASKMGTKYCYRLSGFSWHDYNEVIFDAYFKELQMKLKDYQTKNRRQLITFFLTTFKNRSLLELPWLYIGSHE